MRIIKFFMISLTVLLLGSCGKDTPEVGPVQRTVLVYAVATNSLSGNEERDLAEMVQGIESVDTGKYRWLVYLRSYNAAPTLYEVVNQNGVGVCKTLKEYPSLPLSTTKQRMGEVIADMQSLAPAKEYGLFLWSHASAWEEGNESSFSAAPMRFSYGEDRGDTYTSTSGMTMDMKNLKEAIPSGLFNFIWMDCCYMGSVEVAYELRDKCRYYVGYPTEVLSTGAPYQYVVPLLMGENADIQRAASAMFDYYDSMSGVYRSATVALYDMNFMQELASATSRIMAKRVDIETSGLQCYSRGSYGPYYDFKEYIHAVADAVDVSEEYVADFDAALDKFVIYKDATPSFVGSFWINENKYSGVSTYHYTNSGSAKDNYYPTLDWCVAIGL